MTIATLLVPCDRAHQLARVLGYQVDRLPAPAFDDAHRYRASRVSGDEVIEVVTECDSLRAAIDACEEHADVARLAGADA